MTCRIPSPVSRARRARTASGERPISAPMDAMDARPSSRSRSMICLSTSSVVYGSTRSHFSLECSAYEKRGQSITRDPQALLDPLRAAGPDRILVLDADDAAVAELAEPIDDPPPVQVPEPGDPVAPPAVVPRISAVTGRAKHPEALPPVRLQLDVLGLDMHDVLGPRPDGRHRVYADPAKVRRIPVQSEAERADPFPQLRRVRQVARIPVWMPALH